MNTIPEDISHILLFAEKREAKYFINKAKKINDHLFVKNIKNKNILIIITGVGKNAIKRTIKNQKDIIDAANCKSIINLGNAGSLIAIPKSTILTIGHIIGRNGKDSFQLMQKNHFTNVTVNSLQDKIQLANQYKNAHTVDMELFHLAEVFPWIVSHKIILDTFKMNPKTLLFRLKLPFLIKKNSKLLYSFFINKYLT